MKQKKITYFWIGFIVSTDVTKWLYWLWRNSRVITTAPLVISRSGTYQPVVEQVNVGVEEVVARVDEADVDGEQPDELGAISGVGPATARRLNDAGIFSYKQLSNLSPEKLQEISGTSRWDPNDWIKQAKELGNL